MLNRQDTYKLTYDCPFNTSNGKVAFSPNTMSSAVTNVILLVLEMWPLSPVKARVLCGAVATENFSVIMTGVEVR